MDQNSKKTVKSLGYKENHLLTATVHKERHEEEKAVE